MAGVYSLLQRLRSLRHRLSYSVSESVRWSRGRYRETAAGELPDLPLEQAQRIAALKSRYQVCFEAGLSAATSVRNYEYLDILDQAWAEAGLARPEGGSLCDVGCASFWYAAALHAFFRPRNLVGVEVEGHRLFKDARTRIDYAAGYVAPLPEHPLRGRRLPRIPRAGGRHYRVVSVRDAGGDSRVAPAALAACSRAAVAASSATI